MPLKPVRAPPIMPSMADLFDLPAAGTAKGRGSYTAKDIEVLEGLEPVRRRPGMYIGGTDERAIHHLVAELLDNAMDEVIAGHASWIEIELEADGSLTVRDNGRGIPVDRHPKFKDKSALEVILTTLHSGGKFSDKVYSTAGGLHGVGLSVVNALSDRLTVEVARERRLWVQDYARGKPKGKLKDAGAVSNRRGTTVRFHPDPQIFGTEVGLKPERVYRMARSKAYLTRVVEIRWKCAPVLLKGIEGVPAEATIHFPGGLRDYLVAALEERKTITPLPFAGEARFPEDQGRVEWAIAWPLDGEGLLHSYCNTVPTPAGGSHELGLRTALARGVRAYGELTGNRKAKQITADDVAEGAAILLSLFVRNPQFQGQTKERLSMPDAARLVEQHVKDHFDHWLSADPAGSKLLLDAIIERAEERQRRRDQREMSRKSATRNLRLPGKLADCARRSSEDTEIFLVEGDSAGGSAKQARERESQAVLPLRGKILNVASASADKLRANQELADLTQALGCGLGCALQHGQAALRPRHHHDGRRRGRRPHRLAPHDLLLQGDARAHRGRPALPRHPAALPPESRWQGALRARRQAQGRAHEARVRRPRQGRDEPLQGARRDAAGPAARDDDEPQDAHVTQGGAAERQRRCRGARREGDRRARRAAHGP